MSWSRENGLNVVIFGDGIYVLCDIIGRIVMLFIMLYIVVMIGWLMVKKVMYVEVKIRDVVFWIEEFLEERFLKFYFCNGKFEK